MRYVLLISSSFTFLFQKHAMFIRILEKGGGWLVGWLVFAFAFLEKCGKDDSISFRLIYGLFSLHSVAGECSSPSRS